MRPRELLLFAKWLADGLQPPALQPAAARAAISRAYYAAYHTAYEFLRSFGCPLERGGKGHSDVRAWLVAAGVHELTYAASLLKHLQDVRVIADYGLESRDVETAQEVTQALDWAEDVIITIESCAASQPLHATIRGNLQSAIRRRRP